MIRRMLAHGARAALLAIAALAMPATALAAPGDLDPSFAGGGRVLSSFGALSRADAVAAQADGKLVVAGAVDLDLAIARYREDGSLDPDFGDLGLRRISIHDLAMASAVAVQPDGAIVAAGFTIDGERFSVAVVRLLANGSPDPGFGSGGVVTTSIGTHAAGTEVALAADGALLVAGHTTIAGRDAFVLLRYRADGALDESFGRRGKTVVRFPGEARGWAMALQPDGRIVAGGYGPNPDDLGWIPVLARFLPNGKLDPTFGRRGLVVPLDDGGAIVRAIAVQPDGRILAAFESDLAPSVTLDMAIARLDADGSLDETFAAGGVARVDLGIYDVPHAIGLLPDGAIAVAGQANVDLGSTDDVDMAVARLTRDGALDLGFGAAGRALADFGTNPSVNAFFSDVALGSAILPDGRIALAGLSSWFDDDTFVVSMALARFLGAAETCGDGSIDAGEECDLGAANGTAESCCTATCGFAQGGAICRSSSGACDLAERCTGDDGACPADGGTPDSDGDGTCDALDGCTPFGGTATTATQSGLALVIARAAGGGDRLTLAGRFPLPSGVPFAALAPYARETRVFVEDASGVRLAADVPAALATRGAERGWWLDARGTSWTYLDRSAAPPGGIRRIVLRDRSDSSRAAVEIRVRAVGIDAGGSLAGSTPRMAIALGAPGAPASLCAAEEYAAGDCTTSASDDRVRCRR